MKDMLGLCVLAGRAMFFCVHGLICLHVLKDRPFRTDDFVHNHFTVQNPWTLLGCIMNL